MSPGSVWRSQRRLRPPAGHRADGPFHVADTPTVADPVPGWEHTRLRVATLAPGGSLGHDSGDEETLVVPLTGSFRVDVTDADAVSHTAPRARLGVRRADRRGLRRTGAPA